MATFVTFLGPYGDYISNLYLKLIMTFEQLQANALEFSHCAEVAVMMVVKKKRNVKEGKRNDMTARISFNLMNLFFVAFALIIAGLTF